MEVLKSGEVPALVTNIEVMNILSKRIEKRREAEEALGEVVPKKDSKLRHRDFIEEKVFEYLQSTPCAAVDFQQMPVLMSKLRGNKDPSDNQTTVETVEAEKAEVSSQSKEQGESFNLTDAEMLQVLNHMPTEPVEIHLMMEELSSRMDEDRQNEMLQIISEYAQNGYEADEEIVEEEL